MQNYSSRGVENNTIDLLIKFEQVTYKTIIAMNIETTSYRKTLKDFHHYSFYKEIAWLEKKYFDLT